MPVYPAESDMRQESHYTSAGDFAKCSMKLREEALPKVKARKPDDLTPEEQALVAAYDEADQYHLNHDYPWKMNIVTSVFWIGEDTRKKPARATSVWDSHFAANYGGYDDPDPSARRDYIPIAFVPKQNPFYCALPYNDVENGHFKPEASPVIPWFKQPSIGPEQSVCRDRWVAIRKGNRICYAQWEDCGR